MKFDSVASKLLEQYSTTGYYAPPYTDKDNNTWTFPNPGSTATPKPSPTSQRPPPGDPNWYPVLSPEEANPTLGSTLKQMGNAITSGVRWDVIKNDLAGLFKDRPQQPATPTQQSTKQQSQPTAQAAAEEPITPTQVDAGQMQGMMGGIDSAVQQYAQSNPNFDADLFARSMKANIQKEIDTLAAAGLDNTFINNTVKRNVEDAIKMIPKYADQYKKPVDQQSQQNVTGRTPGQIYGTQGQVWDPWAKQQTSTQQYVPQSTPPPASVNQLNQKFNSGSTQQPTVYGQNMDMELYNQMQALKQQRPQSSSINATKTY
jgi:hypothetical protein